MTFEIKDYFETPVILEPRVELYTVYDFMGKELPGLAIVLDMPIQGLSLIHISEPTRH